MEDAYVGERHAEDIRDELAPRRGVPGAER
jgi:hypothetical protein